MGHGSISVALLEGSSPRRLQFLALIRRTFIKLAHAVWYYSVDCHSMVSGTGTIPFSCSQGIMLQMVSILLHCVMAYARTCFRTRDARSSELALQCWWSPLVLVPCAKVLRCVSDSIAVLRMLGTKVNYTLELNFWFCYLSKIDLQLKVLLRAWNSTARVMPYVLAP